MVSANILFVATVGINALAAIRFVQNAIISWVTQNPSICYIMVEFFSIINYQPKEMLVETSLCSCSQRRGLFSLCPRPTRRAPRHCFAVRDELRGPFDVAHLCLRHWRGQDRRLEAQRSCARAGRRSPEAHSPNHTAKLAFFVALGFVRFVGESRPASRR